MGDKSAPAETGGPPGRRLRRPATRSAATRSVTTRSATTRSATTRPSASRLCTSRRSAVRVVASLLVALAAGALLALGGPATPSAATPGATPAATPGATPAANPEAAPRTTATAPSGPAATDGTDRPVVVEVPVTGPVDPFVARMAKRGIRRAGADGAAAVLIRLDTPGGLDSAMREIVKAVQASPVPVICWVGPAGARAASAGTFILVGCPVAAMAPGTNVGAAHPVGITGDVMSDKVTNDAAAYIRSLAESRGRNADWAEKAVRDSVSISADEAVRMHVIDMVSPTTVELLAAVDGRPVPTARGEVVARTAGATVETESLSTGESLLHTLADPNIAFLFFVLGVAGLVVELLNPGISIPGVGGLILLVTSLVIMSVLPVNVGALVLLAAAFAFFAIDLHVAGHGIPTLAGIACLVVGGLFLYDGAVPEAQVSRPLIIGLALGVAAVFFFVMRGALRARKAPVTTGAEALVGAIGTVVEELTPGGMVAVRGEQWTARLAGPGPVAPTASDASGDAPGASGDAPAAPGSATAGGVAPGDTVRVVAVRGLTLEVVPVAPGADRPPSEPSEPSDPSVPTGPSGPPGPADPSTVEVS